MIVKLKRNPWLDSKHPLTSLSLQLIRRMMVKVLHPDVWSHEAAATALTLLNEAIAIAKTNSSRFVVVQGGIVKWRGHWWEVLGNVGKCSIRAKLVMKHAHSNGKEVEYQATIRRFQVEDCRVPVNGRFNFVLTRHPKGSFSGNHCQNRNGMFFSDSKTIHTALRCPGFRHEEIVSHLLDTGTVPLGANREWQRSGSRNGHAVRYGKKQCVINENKYL